jgi:hypothetical protein
MSTGRLSGYIGRNHSHPMSSQSKSETLDTTVAGLSDLDAHLLRLRWRNHLGGSAPAHLPRGLLLRILAYRLQAATLGDLDKATARVIRTPQGAAIDFAGSPFKTRSPRTRDGIGLNPGALLVREWKGKLEKVMVFDNGFAWNGRTFSSLSQVARAVTGTSWNGHRFFGLRSAKERGSRRSEARLSTDETSWREAAPSEDLGRTETNDSGRDESESIGRGETARRVAGAKRSGFRPKPKPPVPLEGKLRRKIVENFP